MPVRQPNGELADLDHLLLGQILQACDNRNALRLRPAKETRFTEQTAGVVHVAAHNVDAVGQSTQVVLLALAADVAGAQDVLHFARHLQGTQTRSGVDFSLGGPRCHALCAPGDP